MRRLLVLSTLLFLLVSNASAQTREKPFRVVATVGMVADTVKAVGKDAVNVETLIGAGGDPHLYKAAPKDVLALANADIIFYNGLFLEGKMAEVLDRYAKQKPTIPVGERIDPALLLRPVEFAGHYDPHIWMDVSLWSKTVAAVRDALGELDPSLKPELAQNAAEYEAQLAALHAQVKTWIASVPKEQRVLVTAHDAFHYFGRAYDIEVRGIQGISTESEAGLKDINTLVDFLVERKIRAVFVESSVSQKNIMALIEGARARGHEISVGGELYSDAMGPPNTPDGTYLGMLRHNALFISRGLGGSPTEEAK